jgi:hypothetical protein
MAVLLTPAERKAWLALEHVGPATVRDLERLGVSRLEHLARHKPQDLYEQLCRLTGTRQDPCVLDVFSMLVHRARGGDPRPWWEFSRLRLAQAKNDLAAGKKSPSAPRKGSRAAGSAAPGRRRSGH